MTSSPRGGSHAFPRCSANLRKGRDSFVSPLRSPRQICPCSEDICQIRLDFDRFDIAQPETTGDYVVIGTVPGIPNARTNCLDATFTATSDGTTPPIICGTNTGYHSE